MLYTKLVLYVFPLSILYSKFEPIGELILIVPKGFAQVGSVFTYPAALGTGGAALIVTICGLADIQPAAFLTNTA